MRIPNGECPCGSGKAAVDCCYQMQSPIQRKPEIQVNGLKFNASVQLVDSLGIPVTPWFQAQTRGTFKISELFVVEDFILQVVKKAQHTIAQQLPPFVHVTESDKERLLFERALVDNLYRNLKAAHYHCQNFIFRFCTIAEEFSQKPVNVGAGITKVVDQDFPLEFEFESYMMRYRTCVELTVKLIALKATAVDPRKKFNFNGTIEAVSKKAKTPTQLALADVIASSVGWLDEQRKIRNSIAHDGVNEVLDNFEHVRGKTLNATVLDRTADVMALHMFRQLIDFSASVMNTLYGAED